jgi:ABC-2 type transport system ATP-binding protein
MAPDVIEAQGLRMRYGAADVLRGVDLRVGRGEVVAMLGPNGAGKTTTVEILEGFRRRSAGEVTVLGVDPAEGGEAWRARLGVVLQSWRDHGTWRVRDVLGNLGRFYAPYATAGHPRPRGVDDVLGLVGLTGQADAVIATLSGGQRRRLDVALGLVGNPDLLFLDEPTVGFDPQARREFHDLMRSLPDLAGLTVLLTTHDLDEAEKLADRILILVGGTVVAEGTPADLAHRFSGSSRVRYRRDGEPVTVSVADATAYARELFARHGEAISDLEIHRASLEDAYLALVREAETPAGRSEPEDPGGPGATIGSLPEVHA